jgi:hypothetical protein
MGVGLWVRGCVVICAVMGEGMALAQTPATRPAESAPAATRGAATQAADLSTPVKAAAAYYKALIEGDGALLLACVDLQDDNVKVIITAQAGRMDATRQYQAAAKKAFGEVPEQLMPPVFSAQMQRMIAPLLPQAEVVEQGNSATLTPRGMGGPAAGPGPGAGGDMGPLFQMTLTKKDGVWRVRLQDSGQVFKMELDGSARGQAEQTTAENPELRAVALEIEQGKYKTAEEAWKVLRERMQKADQAVQQRWMQQKAGPGAPAAQPGAARGRN